MGWAKFDDRRHTNAKLLAAGLEANGLDANAITYSAANETDGFIPDSALVVLAVGARRPRAVADRLVAVGRWARDDEHGGWWIHDYLKYNPSAADAEARREAEREKKARQRAKADRDRGTGRFTSPGDTNGTGTDVPQGVPPSSPRDTGGVSPVSRPVPSRPPLLPPPDDTRHRPPGNGSADAPPNDEDRRTIEAQLAAHAPPDWTDLDHKHAANAAHHALEVLDPNARPPDPCHAANLAIWAGNHLDWTAVDTTIGACGDRKPRSLGYLATAIANHARSVGIDLPDWNGASS